eukprot:scaffold139032_cov157-Phaeocystis_antarctica.AAC.2
MAIETPGTKHATVPEVANVTLPILSLLSVLCAAGLSLGQRAARDNLPHLWLAQVTVRANLDKRVALLAPTTSRAIRPAGSNACFTAGYMALYSRSLRPRGHISATFKCRRWVRSIMPRARSNSHEAREQRLVTVFHTLSFLAQIVRSTGYSVFVLGDASLSDERAALQAKRLSSPL